MFLALALGACEALDPVGTLEVRCAQSEPDLDACYELGQQALALVRPDVTRARAMFSKGCQTHHARSCNALAEMVDEAKGGPRDPKRAVELYDIACRQQITSACVHLGLALYAGDGTRPNPERAVELFKNTCVGDAVNADACSALGLAYSEGKGVEAVDAERAERLQRKACEAEFALACSRVGDLYRARPEQRPEDVLTAVEFYDKACRLDARHGCMELAQLHSDGTAPDASAEKAALYYQKTCRIDPSRGCFDAAALMESGRVAAREGEIESLYNRACEHGHTAACAKRKIGD
jgi:TPR repeat protein